MFDALIARRHGILWPVKSSTTAIAATGLLIFAACAGESVTTEPAPPNTYEADGIAFTYPADWGLLDGITAAGGSGAAGPVVGFLDDAGNLIGFAVEIQRVDPPVPDGEEDNYLTAVAVRHAAEIWAGGSVSEEGSGFVDGRRAIRSVIGHTARGESLISEVLVAVEGSTLVVTQCQAPTALFDLLAPQCASVVDSLRIEWHEDDSAGGDGD